MRSVGDSQISQSFQDGFYRGNYADLVAQTIDAHPSQIPKGSEVFIIGSLGNLGRLEEATHLFYKLKVTLSLEDRVAAKYHLGVSNTRHSQYDKAVRLFAENLQEARNSDNPVVVFYGFMGLGFYRFFCARFVRCVCAAKKALLASLDAGFTFGKYQAYELLGHAKVNIGKVAEGL